MKDKFIEFWNGIGAKGNPEEEFYTLEKMYSGPHRYYHNLSHIENCLLELEEAGWSVPNYHAAEAAIWYHDITYDTVSTTNEKYSATFAADRLRLGGMGQWFINNVSDIILATAHNGYPTNDTTKYVVDIDLVILGKPIFEFAQYNRNIRKEYSWVSDGAFAINRKKILTDFLEREFIYYTDRFRNLYESRAKTNLEIALSFM